MDRFLYEHNFSFSGINAKNTILGSYGSCMVSSVRKGPAVFQRGCTIVPSLHHSVSDRSSWSSHCMPKCHISVQTAHPCKEGQNGQRGPCSSKSLPRFLWEPGVETQDPSLRPESPVGRGEPGRRDGRPHQIPPANSPVAEGGQRQGLCLHPGAQRTSHPRAVDKHAPCCPSLALHALSKSITHGL